MRTGSKANKLGFEPDFPFNPARWPFFYGWWVVVLGTVIMLSATPSMPMAFGVFIESITVSLGLSRLEISAVFTLAMIISGFLLPWVGRLLDRCGARAVTTCSAFLFGCTLFYLGNSETVIRWLTDGNRAEFRSATAMVVLFLGFFGLRLFGHGVMGIACRTMITKWFNRRRGFSNAVHWITLSLLWPLIPLLLNLLIEQFTWSGAWIAIGMFSGLLISFTCWLFVRDNPEECGLQMDGTAALEPASSGVHDEFETYHEFTVKEALHTLAFWVVLLGIMNNMVFFAAMTFNLLSFGMEMGLTKTQALSIFIPMSVLTIITTLATGWLSNRIKLKYLFVLFFLNQLCSMAAFLLSPAIGASAFIIAFGINGGFFGTLFNVTWPRFFGREHLGAINGLSMAVYTITSAFGPLLFSLSYDYTGSFRTGVIACMVLPAALLLIAFKADNPQRRFLPDNTEYNS